jgi:steroid delta-isomerase
LVDVHRDYWDAAEELFEKLPFVGRLICLLRKKFSASQS